MISKVNGAITQAHTSTAPIALSVRSMHAQFPGRARG